MKDINLIYIRHNVSGKAPRIAPSTIHYFDLTLVLHGKLEYSVNGQEILLEDGDMLFVPAGSLRARQESAENADYISFNFTAEGSFTLPLLLKRAVRSEIALLITAYDKMSKRAFSNSADTAAHLCACLLSHLEDIAAAAQFNPLTKKIMEYIHSDIGRKITLADIGNLTFFSPIYCDTVFKKEVGRSIVDYALDRRIEEARRLLLEGTMPLAEIAEAVGFDDYNYFSRVFKKRSGYSPTAYRRLSPRELKN